jgi:hypothetical protein
MPTLLPYTISHLKHGCTTWPQWWRRSGPPLSPLEPRSRARLTISASYPLRNLAEISVVTRTRLVDMAPELGGGLADARVVAGRPSSERHAVHPPRSPERIARHREVARAVRAAVGGREHDRHLVSGEVVSVLTQVSGATAAEPGIRPHAVICGGVRLAPRRGRIRRTGRLAGKADPGGL